jgi:arylsulfatase A-like enzyme
MEREIKNVIILGVDSLRTDRTLLGGYEYDTAPTITSLAKEGIYCENSLTNSGPTQLAFPSIATSTYPLDFGGYDVGIKSRPPSLAEVLKNEGYSTFTFATDHAGTKPNGYAEGYDYFESIYDLDTIWKNATIYTRYYSKLREEGVIDHAEYVRLNNIYFLRITKQTIEYCDEALLNFKKTLSKYNDLYPYNFKVLKSVFKNHLKLLETSPEKFIKKYSNASDINDYLTLIEFIRVYRRSLFSFFIVFKKFKFFKILFYKIRGRLYKNFASSDYMTDTLIKWIDENKENKFFANVFYADAHDFVSSQGKADVFKSGLNRFLSRINLKKKRLIERISLSEPAKASKLYDASVSYIDENIARVIDYLTEESLIDSTLIVIFSDHGTQLNIQSTRDLTATFYDEYVRVPLIFFSPNLNNISLTANIGLVDMAPTIIDILGIDEVSHFQGLPVYSDKASKREYFRLENAGRGPCDIKRKFFNIGFRGNKWKFIYKEKKDGFDIELYDLDSDPLELTNVSEDTQNTNVVKNFIDLAKIRCSEIREINETKDFST